MSIEKIVSLCKRRGFIFQSSDIYGGFKAVYDYGPLGVALKNNISQLWWKAMTQIHENIVGLDSAILMHPKIWEASGHVGAFNDPLVDCKHCKARFRADELTASEQTNWKEMICPKCGTKGSLTEPRQFNLMFKTHIGPVQSDSNIAYLRPETAQGIYVNYLLVQNAMRLKLPFGIAQVGKAFRNEIVARNFVFRTREFEQMEMEFFCEPDKADEWFEYWINFSNEWFINIGLSENKLRKRAHTDDEKPHYAKAALDIEYNFPWGWGELETINNRSDHDLKSHSEMSGKDLSYFDESTKERYIPYVIEPAMGADRTVLAILCDAYSEEEVDGDKRTVLKFKPQISPVQVAILPLSKNEKLAETSESIYKSLKGEFRAQFDNTQSIGKRYRRQDEIGTPICLTIDFDTVETDNCVTLRHRDTMDQIRVKIDDIKNEISKMLKSF